MNSVAPSKTNSDAMQAQPLILAGGLSSRMGQPKHLLMLPNGDTLLQHVLGQVVIACPWIDKVYISLRCTISYPKEPSNMVVCGRLISVIVVYDDLGDRQPVSDGSHSRGPAAGMLAAHQSDPTATFLVIACDFPLLNSAAVQFLLSSYQAPVTCYQNEKGFCEPLFGLWSPDALIKLHQNMSTGFYGPSKVVKQVSGYLISPPPGKEACLKNTNTPEEWQEALRLISSAAR